MFLNILSDLKGSASSSWWQTHPEVFLYRPPPHSSVGTCRHPRISKEINQLLKASSWNITSVASLMTTAFNMLRSRNVQTFLMAWHLAVSAKPIILSGEQILMKGNWESSAILAASAVLPLWGGPEGAESVHTLSHIRLQHYGACLLVWTREQEQGRMLFPQCLCVHVCSVSVQL